MRLADDAETFLAGERGLRGPKGEWRVRAKPYSPQATTCAPRPFLLFIPVKLVNLPRLPSDSLF